MNKSSVIWVSDSSGNLSCHVNGPDLTLKESYIGRIFQNAEGAWMSEFKDGPKRGPFNGYLQAKMDVENGTKESK